MFNIHDKVSCSYYQIHPFSFSGNSAKSFLFGCIPLFGYIFLGFFIQFCYASLVAGSLEAAYSLNWGAREIWGKGGGETLALL